VGIQPGYPRPAARTRPQLLRPFHTNRLP